jgi:vitamin B12/bleomycin/antimicrobial peptide transport system ATP-binding/permease protein
MADPAATDGGDALSRGNLASELARMGAAFWRSSERNFLLGLSGALIVVLSATAYAQIRLNAWNKPFYDALTHKDWDAFLEQLGVFAAIAAVLLVLNVTQMWLNQTAKVILRQGLVHELLDDWLQPLRAFRLSNAGTIGVNPDQRLHADAQHLTDLTTDLGIGLLQATLLLLSFIGVLWLLSRQMILPFAGHDYYIPGYMVWWALLYAGTASLFSWLVGRPLVRLDAQRYAREADLRFALVRANEEIEGITIFGGEGDEKTHLNQVLATVIEVSRRIVGALTRLTWVTAGYGWVSIVAPILVAAPSYMTGRLTFGELMVAVGAFTQVQTSLRWFVDNFSNLADWRATLLRISNFRNAIRTMDSMGAGTDRIELHEVDGDQVSIDELHVAAPIGAITLSEPHIALKTGERLLVVGERGSGRTLLFQAIVGIWPWGHGRITRPPRGVMLFLPARAYVPPGSLRSALAYPHSTSVFDDREVAAAFAAVGLPQLVAQLDVVERWDRRLSEDEKQCLAFARVLLQKPHWLVLDGVLEGLDGASRRRVEGLLSGTLCGLGLISIGEEAEHRLEFARSVRLLTDPQGMSFEPVKHAAAASQEA